MRWRYAIFTFLAVILFAMAAVFFYRLPPVHERLSWRLASLQAQVRRALNPPEQVVFVPQQAEQPSTVETIAQATMAAMAAQATPTQADSSNPGSPEESSTPFDSEAAPPTETPLPTPTPTFTPTPIPEKVVLSGIVHEYQQFNNCAPANLAMALSYWGWQGDQGDTRAYLRPNLEVDDKNVMPAEMVKYVEETTGLSAVTRVGGDQALLKRLVAAGFPVIIEAGHHPPKDWWMGHFLVINAYDDLSGRFVTQDSLIQPDLPLPYEELAARWWRDFNYVYLVIYPPERQAEVLNLLGSQADEASAYQEAAQRARDEIPTLEGRDQFFAWFNLGSSLVGLQDYVAASEAYDKAFAKYQKLSEEQRPYRLMWYQDGPYHAYFYSGRYQDVVNLANATFSWAGQPVLEESYYWRGMAYEALGELNLAITDFKKAAALNPNFLPPREALQRLGVEMP